jgi:serine/threonine-protein kinase
MADRAHHLEGRVFGNWRLARRIGEGSFGAIYEAANTTIAGRHAAIKVLHPRASLRGSAKRRFIAEAAAASSADHENLIHIYDGGIADDGTCYLVMELLRGAPLSTVIARGRVRPERAIHIAIQIAAGLHAAHRIGVVHRDLKPENVFLVARPSNREFVKILDFGVAKLHGDLAGSLRTEDGAWMGTPKYMSPEQWQALPDVDGRADVYALGLILFECLRGRPPFGGDTHYALMMAHLQQPVPDLGGDGDGAEVPPRALRELVGRMLAKRREDRPQTMLEVMQVLRALRGDPMGADELASATAPLPEELRATLSELARADERRDPHEAGRETDERDDAGRSDEAAPTLAHTSAAASSRPAPRGAGGVGAVRARWLLAVGGLSALALAAAFAAVRSDGPRGAPAARSSPSTGVGASARPLPVELVALGPGTIMLGSGGAERVDGPPHPVAVGRFAIGRFEVSMSEYRDYARAVGLRGPLPWDGIDDFASIARLPVNLVNQADAARYCAWRYRDRQGRLPTEAEWEYAARDGDGARLYPWPGDRLEERRVNLGRTALDPVDAHADGATAHGVFNLIGNVAEWTASDGALYPSSRAPVAPRGVVVRGGSLRSEPAQLSASARAFSPPERRDPVIGFRCAAGAD